MDGLTVYVVVDVDELDSPFAHGVYTERWRADLRASQEREWVVEAVMHVGDGRVGEVSPCIGG